MKYFLITTSDKRSWGSHQNNIFLGSWCESFGKENPENLKIQNYHWDDKEKFERDIQYLNDLYETKLDELSIAMNKIHNETNNKSFWRIIIGPWLKSFIDVVFDRYESIDLLNSEHEIDNTYCLKANYLDWTPKDFNEYFNLPCGRQTDAAVVDGRATLRLAHGGREPLSVCPYGDLVHHHLPSPHARHSCRLGPALLRPHGRHARYRRR